MKNWEGNQTEIYILHEYEDKSHFKALYESADEYGYIIKDYIILSKKFIFKKAAKMTIRNKQFVAAIKYILICLYNLYKISRLSDKVLIVGIAPYDCLLNKYKNVFSRNKCIYFSSWQHWDGKTFAKGNKENRESFEDILRRNFKAAACVSELTKQGLKDKFNYLEVVYHSINIKEYEHKITYNDTNVKKFIFLGGLTKNKNIELLINWIEQNKQHKFEFHFAGIGILMDNILDLCSKDNRVRYLGVLTKDEIKSQLKDYDYLVLPSKSELFGIVLIEALAAGVPCIVSDALGPREVIVNNYNGFVFDKDNYESFNEVMRDALCLDKQMYYELSNNCLIESEKYYTSNIAKVWVKLIKYAEDSII
jgi:glycosyltransferase involved in cell wall biosynthesis